MSALALETALDRHGVEAMSDATRTIVRARTFHTFDALRGLAALVVVLYHTSFFYGLARPAEGQMAVDLFFVLSGFIIAYRYDGEFRAGLRVRDFAVIRLVRLYPLYVLGAVLGVVPALLAVAAGDLDPFHEGMVASLPLHLAMVPSWLTLPKVDELYPLNYVAWSLVLEILVNIAYAATFAFWTERRLLVLLAGAAVALCGCAAAYGSLIGGFAWSQAPVGVARVLFGFPAGVLLYRVFERRPFELRLPWWCILIAAAAIFFFHVPVSRPVWELFCITIVIPAIVAAAAVNEPPRAFQAGCALAGIFSYVIYSIHAPLIGFFLRGEERLHLDLRSHSATTAWSLTLLFVVVSVLAHVAYDKPIRRFLTRRLGTKRPRPVLGTVNS